MQVLNIKPVPTGQHKLPPLPYAYDALEPYIDEKTLKIHHDIHHKKYVDDLNKTEIKAQEMRKSGNFDNINLIEENLAFNGSGHILHSIYWTIMAPPGTGGNPGSVTDTLIKSYFGSFEEFKNQFIQAALQVRGSGWAVLGYNPYFRRLEILQAGKHEDMTQWGIIPVLVCDVWEHAYYLKYQNKREDYIRAQFDNLINWNEVENRLLYAVQSKGVLDI
ncbi:MAG: superoxide dismutase [Oscillospiraceae bacterium]|nr:superoxide dismutase [Oscillospiraceae bacterium]